MAITPTPRNFASNNTVYVRNLEERVKLPELTTALREIFSEYGNIVDLVAKRNLKAKGQAFVVFDSPESAANAIEEIQGFEVFEKPMILEFAKTQSDATVKATQSTEELEAHKNQRLAAKMQRQATEAEERARRDTLKRSAPDDVEQKSGQRPVKLGAGLKSTSKAAVVPDEYLPPNKTLFLQNLPDDYDVDGLSAIFGRFEAFREARLVPGRKGIAFVEYEHEVGAIRAKDSLSGMALGSESKQMKITFQRA